MASIKVSYSISSETKDVLDNLKKNYNMNLSEMVDMLLKFDPTSLSKMFEMYKKLHPTIIEEYNRVETSHGFFVWNENTIEALKNIPLKDITTDMLPILASKVVELSESTKEEEYAKMLKHQHAASTATMVLIRKYKELEKEIKNLKKEVDTLKNK